ncbi:MAG TPA: hypothetical protein VLZ03_03620 [Thermodesulfobacteriota bacterium]|nr:hypothetical protein [Thermodesulfobacteriota bacterium]
MRDTGRKSRAIKMPQVEFDLEAVKEIKERKKRVYERYVKQSKKSR